MSYGSTGVANVVFSVFCASYIRSDNNNNVLLILTQLTTTYDDHDDEGGCGRPWLTAGINPTGSLLDLVPLSSLETGPRPVLRL